MSHSEKNWMVLANASRARILEQTGTEGVYVDRADFVHPASRMKGVELADDRPGRAQGGSHGTGGAGYDPRTDPRRHQHELFARELAAALNEGVATGQCAGLLLVASNPFLGLLMSHLDARATEAVLRVVPHDYTTLADDALAQRIGAVRIGQ